MQRRRAQYARRLIRAQDLTIIEGDGESGEDPQTVLTRWFENQRNLSQAGAVAAAPNER